MTGDRAELFRALAVLSEPPEPGHAAVAEALGLPGTPSNADYTDVFLLQVYPYASVYLGPEGMMGGEARDRVAGFWRALGLTPPPEPDHLGALLGLYASLIESEAAETDEARALLRRSSRQALLWEHLLSWCPPYLAKVRELPSPVYAAWADLLDQALLAELKVLGVPSELPKALQEHVPLPDPTASADEWVKALLAPARSGIILTRADLAAAAAELGIGLRVGERAFILRALLEQDQSGTAAWLARSAGSAASGFASGDAMLDTLTAEWTRRARETSSMLS